MGNPAMSVRWWTCFFGHHWAPWTDTDKYEVIDTYGWGLPIRDWQGRPQYVSIAAQERRCSRCGRTNVRPR
jgi:hypothetical protein